VQQDKRVSNRLCHHSGPKRFDMSENSLNAEWLDTREKKKLQDQLYKEIEQLCGVRLAKEKELK